MNDSEEDINKASAPPSSLEKYREWLVKSEHQASQDFDKAILTLAGGALGLSLVFIDPIKLTGLVREPWLLVLSWFSLASSLLAGLASLLTSRRALRTCIAQLDGDRLGRETPGGRWAGFTEWLNLAAAGLLVGGVICLVTFAWLNIGRATHEPQPTIVPKAGATAPTTGPTAGPTGEGLPTAAPAAPKETTVKSSAK
jgi:hypothetical protein